MENIVALNESAPAIPDNDLRPNEINSYDPQQKLTVSAAKRHRRHSFSAANESTPDQGRLSSQSCHCCLCCASSKLPLENGSSSDGTISSASNSLLRVVDGSSRSCALNCVNFYKLAKTESSSWDKLSNSSSLTLASTPVPSLSDPLGVVFAARTDSESGVDLEDLGSFGRSSSNSNRCANQPPQIIGQISSARSSKSSTKNSSKYLGQELPVQQLQPQSNYNSYNLVCRKRVNELNKQACASPGDHFGPGGVGWQGTKSSVKERLSFMCMNSEYADIFFIFKDKHGNVEEKIPAHKFVLTIGSAVFDAMFRFGDSAGDGCSNCIREVELLDVEPKAFASLLTFLYTDQVNITPDSVMTILYTAKKYAVPELEMLCVNFLKENLNTENAFMLLTQARLFDEQNLSVLCLDIIDRECAEALKADGFLGIDRDTLCAVLQRDTLRVSEVLLFRALLSWSAEACKTRDLPLTPENRREVLGNALKLIRFPLMKAEEFAEFVAPTRLLTDAEMVAIFLYHHKKQPVDRPLDFQCQPRGCLVEKEMTVNRFQRIEASWGYSGTPDRIKFSVDTPVWIIGFGLYGSIRDAFQYPVIIEIINFASGQVLAKNESSFFSDGSPSTFRVLFQKPVEIASGITYIASVKLSGSKESHYGSKGLRRIVLQCPNANPSTSSSSTSQASIPNTITWQFSYAAGNNNGTSVDDGQIPEIIFCLKH